LPTFRIVCQPENNQPSARRTALAAIKTRRVKARGTFLRVHESEALAADDQWTRDGAAAGTCTHSPASRFRSRTCSTKRRHTLGGSKSAGWYAGGDTRLDRRRAIEKDPAAVIIGRTNLVRVRLSLLGLNPHYGTPKNAFDRAPAASRRLVAGAAVSVTTAWQPAQSVRIPADRSASRPR